MEKKILLVDDELGIRKVLGISLADLGYEVMVAENGREALELFHRNTPPIVLTDIKMPVMDGVQLLQHIKRASPETEVIMLTGHGDMDLAIKCLKLEALDFITKPINDDVLEIALKRACEKIIMKQQLRDYTQNLERMVSEKSAQLIEAERRAAVGQTLEGFSRAISDLAGDLDSGINFFNEMPCYVSLHDNHYRIVGTNRLYKERFGDRVGQGSNGIYSGDAGLKDQCPVAGTFLNGRGEQRNETVIGLNGVETPVMVHTAPIRNREGAVELVMEIAADIAEVKRLQEQLRTTRQLYQQLFDEAPCYITLQDRAFNIVAANRRFKKDFNDKPGGKCYSVYKDESTSCPDCPVARTFDDGKSHQCEMEVTSKDGRKYQLLIWTAPIRNISGKTTQVMEMATNITQVRELQDQLAGIGVLIGSVSHGIKGLLTGLDSGIYLLDSGLDKKDPDQLREGWDIVKMMVGRIRSMVMDILFYAKQRELNWKPVEVIHVVRELADAIRSKADARGMAVDLDIDIDVREPLGSFEVDTVALNNALTSIIDNAMDACETAEAGKRHRISFSARRSDDYLVFDIGDTGPGLSKEAREKIFTIFYTSKGEKGTGMGLFLSYRIVRQHGGDITVDSSAGTGTRFRIRLPARLPDAVKKMYPPSNAIPSIGSTS
ncbi:MAG: response regulator [Desulfobacteraceae bacterium]|nr:response regulator [Desulfobacteraceae bacterium]